MLPTIDYSKLRASLRRLEEQHDNHGRGNPALSGLEREAVAESVIQRFEICYDCLWKVLKRYLIEELGVAEAPNSPKPVFRLADDSDLLASPLDRWFEYARARTDTSHDYDGDKASRCLDLVPGFLDDAISLYQRMTGAKWK